MTLYHNKYEPAYKRLNKVLRHTYSPESFNQSHSELPTIVRLKLELYYSITKEKNE